MSTYSFPWAEKDIGDDLSAGGGHEETNSLVLVGLLAEGTSVDILEHLVESELSESLEAVSNEGWEPSLQSN